jgi:hypothetical protein
LHERCGPRGEPARQGNSVGYSWSLFRCLNCLCAPTLQTSRPIVATGLVAAAATRWTSRRAVQGACQLFPAPWFDELIMCAVVTGRHPVPVPGFDPRALGLGGLGGIARRQQPAECRWLLLKVPVAAVCCRNLTCMKALGHAQLCGPGGLDLALPSGAGRLSAGRRGQVRLRHTLAAPVCPCEPLLTPPPRQSSW